MSTSAISPRDPGHRYGLLPLLASCLVLTSACDSDVTTAPGDLTLRVTPSTLTLAVGDTARLTGQLMESSGAPAAGSPIVWSSDGPAVATVTSSGLVTGRAEGTATIRASSEGETGTAQVTVLRPSVISVVVDPSHAVVEIGDSLRFAATALAANGDTLSDRSVSWSTSDPTVVAIGADGLATALRRGSAELRATSDGVTGVARIEVRAPVTVGVGQYFACALTHGEAFCWGANDEGQLGRNHADSVGPVGRVAGTQGFEMLSVGNENACALRQGVAYCWGAGALFGQEMPVAVPTAVAASRAFTTISVGGRHACALDEEGGAWCWGNNDLLSGGQLGDGTTVSRAQPAPVSGDLTFDRISAGFAHTCGISDGSLYCWGGNDPWSSGVFGEGRDDPSYPLPIHIALPFQPAEVWAGALLTCATPAVADPHCWGWNARGQLGRGSDEPLDDPKPAPLSSQTPLTHLSAPPVNSTAGPTCGLDADGRAWCWGGNYSRQLGRTTTKLCYWFALDGWPCDGQPAPVDFPLTFWSVAAGASSTCGVTTDGSVYCWGRNKSGELGGPGGPEAVRVLLGSGGQYGRAR